MTMTTETVEAWAVIMRQKRLDLAEIRETRTLVQEILDELEPWQAKCICDGLAYRYRDEWGNPKRPDKPRVEPPA